MAVRHGPLPAFAAPPDREILSRYFEGIRLCVGSLGLSGGWMMQIAAR
jgi:hypothetical protein